MKWEWDTISNPRKSNGDLGDLECDICECQTGAYIFFDGYHICKGCLLKGVKAIDDTILGGLTYFSDKNKI